MTPRLYLIPRGKYRVRLRTGRVVIAHWHDEPLAFVAGRAEIAMDDVVAVADFDALGRHAIPWRPITDCYRAIHRPVPSTVAWVHPYAARRAAA